ncbi:MAG: hypothetical protein OXK77_14400 [Gemmatimonadota bacterium]|nr:hypothetical protein [Gemmatimonadota bacterium]MDE2863924.1 hypothetical protein [Gemmatimonadota bacterium]
MSYGRQRGTRIVATAQHVIEAAIGDQTPIHVAARQRILTLGAIGLNIRFVHKTTRGVDSAILAFVSHDLPRPTVPILDPANPEELSQVKVGTEVGWLGFPDLQTVAGRLCFFSGRISLVDPAGRFLLDGTNVQGCSGGPAFCVTPDGPRIIGVVTDYFPNENFRNTEGEPIGLAPGLTAVADVTNYKSIEAALNRLPDHKVTEQTTTTIELTKCAECGAGLVKGEYPGEQTPTLLCSNGCGPLIDLLDERLVNQFPGEARGFNQYLCEAHERVTK